jgi:hypothetical protein
MMMIWRLRHFCFLLKKQGRKLLIIFLLILHVSYDDDLEAPIVKILDLEKHVVYSYIDQCMYQHVHRP